MTSSHQQSKPVLVPIGITFGLAIFAIILCGLGFVFRLLLGESWQQILPNLLLTGGIFLVAIPFMFWIGSKVMNHFSQKPPIQNRNAITLGFLVSCVAMLWLMSAYS